MAEVYITDAPGGDYQVYQCPNCSRYHPAVEIDDQGMPRIELNDRSEIIRTVGPPANCRRCPPLKGFPGGCPMDIEESKKYQLAYTDLGNQPGRPATRQTVHV